MNFSQDNNSADPDYDPDAKRRKLVSFLSRPKAQGFFKHKFSGVQSEAKGHGRHKEHVERWKF